MKRQKQDALAIFSCELEKRRLKFKKKKPTGNKVLTEKNKTKQKKNPPETRY